MLKVGEDEMLKRAQSFHAYIKAVWTVFQFPVGNVANMDESPLSFTGSSKALKSLSVKGLPNVVGVCHGLSRLFKFFFPIRALTHLGPRQ